MGDTKLTFTKGGIVLKKVNVGVIGLGHNGNAFCERYLKNEKSRLVAVCDLDRDRLEIAMKKYNVKGFSNYDILKEPDIDLISIHTPDHLHKEPFIKAIEYGHHVFVEKPMADTEEDLFEMVKIAENNPGKVYAVGHVLRFNAYFQLVKKWLELDILGDIFYIECDYIHDLRYQYFMEEWKTTNEIPVLGGGCHAIDLLIWFVGDIVEVVSFSNRMAYPDMKEDSSMVTILKFKNGCTGKVTSLYGNRSPRPYAFNFSIYGTKGTIVRDKLSIEGLGEKWIDIPEIFDEHHDYMPEIDHVLDCIINNKPALVTPREGLKASIAGLYAVRSAEENRIIKLPEI